MIRHPSCLLHFMNENAAIQLHAPGWSPADRALFRAASVGKRISVCGSFTFTCRSFKGGQACHAG